MDRKYIITEETRVYKRRVLHSIKAVRDFGDVKAGDLGGWIEHEGNLSHEGNCWIHDEAKVYDDAKVLDNAQIYGGTEIYHEAYVHGSAFVAGYVKIYDNAEVFGDAQIIDNVEIYGYAKVYDNVEIRDNAIICQYAEIADNAIVKQNAKIGGHSFIYGDAIISGNALIHGTVCINTAEIEGNAIIQLKEDYITFKNWWALGSYITWTRSNNMWKEENFYGTGKELIDIGYERGKKSGYNYKAIVDYVENIVKPQLNNTLVFDDIKIEEVTNTSSKFDTTEDRKKSLTEKIKAYLCKNI